VGSPPLFILLDAPFSDLTIDGLDNLTLGLADGLDNLRATANDIQSRPGQQGGDRIEVAAVGVAPQAGSLKRQGSAAAEGVAHARDMAEASSAQFSDKLRQVFRLRTEVGVDYFPHL